MNTKLKVLDLFSGIGAIGLGLERAGMETVAFCEIDEKCSLVLQKNFPGKKIFKDIKEVDSSKFNEDIDVVCGGYPCTGHSVAGKKQGFKNEASGLWGEYRRIIKEIKPKYVIIENSHNLRSTGLAELLKDIWEIGYNAEWSIISAYSVGSPHQRERIYIVAWRTDVSYCDPFRSWNSNSQEAKSKSEWWAKGWIKRSPLFREITSFEPKVLRIDDGAREGLDAIEERIKQLGNAALPQISELIGKRIVDWEPL
jgi:DNA (cytosine-5)-methyltransferase 1